MKTKNLLKLLMLATLMTGCGNATTSSSASAPASSSNTPISSSTKDEVKVLGVEVTSENDVTTIKEEQTLQLTAVVYPENANQSVVWSSSDNLVATVSETGLVTGVSRGQVVITAASSVDSTIVGNYLTTTGFSPEDDAQMIEKLGRKLVTV